MFKHQGSTRTLKDNLHIATVLSFVAGIVNITGFLSFSRLTTNITGHFATFTRDITEQHFWAGIIFLSYITSFLFGSFSSGYLIEKFRETKRLNVFLIPTLVESVILLSIGILSNFTEFTHPDVIVCLLLFAMGLQNSFVTKISNAIVRTTHLTGLFTDLGIDLSQLFFPKSETKRVKLKDNIKLRLYIILFFFSGGFIGGYLYSKLNFQLNTLIIGALILIISILYDDFRFRRIIVKSKKIASASVEHFHVKDKINNLKARHHN